MANKTPNNLDENGNLLITKEELAEFKSLALKEYGVVLTDERALEQGGALLKLFDRLVKYRVSQKLNNKTEI